MAGMNRIKKIKNKKVQKTVKDQKKVVSEPKTIVKKPDVEGKKQESVQDLIAKDFPHGYDYANVIGDGMLCGLRALIKAYNARYPSLPFPNINQLKKIAQDPEVQTLSKEKGLSNTSHFYVEQLANIIRKYGTSLENPIYIELGLMIQDRAPLLTSWPLDTPPTHRIWIYTDNASALSGSKLGIQIVDHFMAVVPKPDKGETKNTVDTTGITALKSTFDPPTKKQEAEAEKFDISNDIFASEKSAADIDFEKNLTASFGKLDYSKETLPSGGQRELAKSFTAYLINPRTGKPISKDGNSILQTRISFRVDYFRAYVKVRTSVEKEEDTHMYDSEDDESEDEAGIVSEKNEEVVEACYTYQSLINQNPKDNEVRGIRPVDLSDISALSSDLQAEVAALHKSTLKLVEDLTKEGETPILLDIFHAPDFLSKGIHSHVPVWGTRVANALKGDRHSRILIAGFANTLDDIKVFGEFIYRNPSPLSRYHNGRKRWIYSKNGLANIGEIQNTGFQRMIQFHDIDEYATVMWITHGKELEILHDDIREFEMGFKIVHLVESCTTTKDSIYYGFIEYTPEGTFRPRHGDTFKMSFQAGEDFDDNKKYWTFTVDDPIGITPTDVLCGIVHRPWDRTHQVFDADDPNVFVINKKLDLTEARKYLSLDAGNKCRLKYVESNKADKNIFNSFDLLVCRPIDKPATAFTERAKQVLLARHFNRLELHNFFHGPMASLQINDVRPLMNLDGKQNDVVSDLYYAAGGFSITQGPPGTGKTYTIVEIGIPFILAPESSIYLVASPSNAGADDIAISFDRRINELRNDSGIASKYPHVKKDSDCLVIRLHSKGSEYAVGNLPVFLTQDRPADARPLSFPEEATDLVEDLSEFELMIHHALKQNKTAEIPGINDPRVKHLHLSVGARMMQAIGLWPNDQGTFDPPWPGFEKRHDRLRAFILRKVKGKKLAKDEIKTYGLAVLALYTEVLQKARVVVGTTAGISMRGLLDIIKDFVAAITFDENAREAELSLLPIFTTSFSRNPGVHLVGDQNQLKPMSKVNRKFAITASQKELPLMKRLIIAGFDFHMLDKQWRMHEDIVTPVNRFFYNNKLSSAPNLHARPGTSEFKQAAKTVLNGRFTNAFWINIEVPRSDEDGKKKSKNVYEIKVGLGNSKSCEFHALYGVKIAVEFINILRKANKDGRLAILTQYTDQKNLYLKASQKMLTSKYEGYHNLHVDTIDGAQGLEFDYVVLDLVVDWKIGMLDEFQRVNVALTRAKSGLIILANNANIGTATGNARAIRDTKNYFKQSGRIVTIRSTGTWPPCEYLTPSASEKPRNTGFIISNLSSGQILAGEVAQKPEPRELQAPLGFSLNDNAPSEKQPGNFDDSKSDSLENATDNKSVPKEDLAGNKPVSQENVADTQEDDAQKEEEPVSTPAATQQKSTGLRVANLMSAFKTLTTLPDAQQTEAVDTQNDAAGTTYEPVGGHLDQEIMKDKEYGENVQNEEEEGNSDSGNDHDEEDQHEDSKEENKVVPDWETEGNVETAADVKNEWGDQVTIHVPDSAW